MFIEVLPSFISDRYTTQPDDVQIQGREIVVDEENEQ